MTEPLPLVGVTATGSSTGKTLVALTLMECFRGRDVRVQPFKVGPDFIDPLYHRALTGRPSACLDGFFSDSKDLRRVVDTYGASAQIGVVEGVMGLYDGMEGQPGRASTADVFRRLEVPYVLVLDATGRSHSVAAEAHGFLELRPDLTCLGLVLNRVASARHQQMLTKAVERWLDVPVLGCIPRDPDFELPSRHLGLVSEDLERGVHRLRRSLRRRLLDQGFSPDGRLPDPRDPTGTPAPRDPFEAGPEKPTSPRIGVARDRAFQFYYDRNLRQLRHRGARLVPVSPLEDPGLPPALDGLYLGGGYPEEHLPELASNRNFMQDLRARLCHGLPVLAECGGLMYLSREVVHEDRADLVGWFPVTVRMRDSFQALSYVRGILDADSWLGDEGTRFRGHEFHYSRASVTAPSQTILELDRGTGLGRGRDGLVRGRAVGCYTHLYFPACGDLADRFVASCDRYRRRHRGSARNGSGPGGSRENTESSL